MKHLQVRYRLIFNEAQIEVLDRVCAFAERMHADQKRDSGEPYIIHPIAVANILLDLGLDYCTVAAALLHDCIEDTPATDADVRTQFGGEIADLVMGVTKLDKITFKSKEEEQAENFRRMFFAMAKDIRVILIKLADRLHNMRTISGISEARQMAMAKETLEIYAPLASRLGLSYLKCELEDLCLKVLHPAIYDRLSCEVALKRTERQDLVAHICKRLTELLKELHINGEVSGRPKHFYSIYKKMAGGSKTFDQIYDLTAVRVIVENVKDCYEVLGMIHTMWKPIPGRFKDYIAVPKPNNYQSLHTTVMTSYGMPFEIQIRTYEMHKIAEYGIAAHWKYKEHRVDHSDLDEKLEWLRGVMDVQGDAATPQEFYESLKLDLYSGQVFIFTPKGDVIALPEGSTPVDFAYSVHSEVGNKCVGAKINNKMVPLETKLQMGDFVEIITSNASKGPSRDWLRFVKSTQAKTKIRAFFKKEMKDDNIKKGKDMLEHEAKARGFTLSQLFVPKWLDVIMQRYSISSMDDMYAAIGYGGFTVNQILLKLIDFYKREQNEKRPERAVGAVRKTDGQGIIVKGHDDLLVRLARCCNPVPGDDIIGFISRGRGIAIHRKSCPNLKNIEDFRLIEAHWANAGTAPFVVTLQIEAANSGDLLAKITSSISGLKLSIDSLNARLDKNQRAIINLGVRVQNIEQVETLLSKVEAIAEVEKVFRQ
ncbi:MAG: bifunctional (p)ppGpp synthetase/guanosine-3',5'-bis(diphosphate) 3'-pyrophosphohydrolase [Clostridia bacterium]|jgi:guanosine-3',5'-bis(diphosphate) 3'-pyrophosphohydrolase|nr:bifunctional (p)ppGpp synthetase/guanosine-3',5'-bis(diphosphate) 3'-pyrophosphohydrolase [Clostridia bacterium]